MPVFENQSGSFRQRPLLFIDLEMTGLDVNRHEIVEIAALVVTQPDFQAVHSYYTKVIPTHLETADPASLKVIDFDPVHWGDDAVPLRQALEELSALAPNCLLAGWGVQNEWDFLNAALQKENLPYFYDHHLIEVYTLAFIKLYPELDLSHINLPNVAKKLGIHLEKHKPDSDIRVTYQIFKRLSGLATQNPASMHPSVSGV